MASGKTISLAKIIRVVTVPPVMAAALIVTLRCTRTDIISTNSSVLFSLLFLAVVPVLAYPAAAVIKPLRSKGREGQRDTAFVMSLVGYTGALLYGILNGLDNAVLFIYGTYFFSVVILLIFNKLLRMRASGHACSVAGPMVIIIYFLGGWSIPICTGVYAASFWASVTAKRHTVREYLLGTASVIIAGVIAWLIYIA